MFSPFFFYCLVRTYFFSLALWMMLEVIVLPKYRLQNAFKWLKLLLQAWITEVHAFNALIEVFQYSFWPILQWNGYSMLFSGLLRATYFYKQCKALVALNRINADNYISSLKNVYYVRTLIINLKCFLTLQFISRILG